MTSKKKVTNRDEKNIPNESGRLTDEIKTTLKLLAEELSTDYCTASFSDVEKKTVRLSEIFHENVEYSRYNKMQVDDPLLKHRNILIIGSGATNDSYKCIPMGRRVIEEIYKDNPNIDQELVSKRFKQSMQELFPKEANVAKPKFENTLSLLTQWYFTPAELSKQIVNYLDFRYPPSLFFEIAAHMFKHSFIDVIVNFNFDELLDNSIEEELGRENYFHVLSDGDCVPISDIVIDGRLKVPVYIKPHGTFKHKSSLRFTNRHYLDMPDQIKELLKDLVAGNCDNEKNIRTNIICVGFNLDSMEFNQILDDNLHKNSRIFHFTWEDEKRDFRCNGKGGFTKNVLPKFHRKKPDTGYEQRYFRIAVESLNPVSDYNGLMTPLSEMFSYLWRQVFTRFKDEFRPRSIGQHEIISYLFYDRRYREDQWSTDLSIELKKRYVNCYDTSDKKEKKIIIAREEEGIEAYFLDRTIVEIAIAINRNNGIVELAQLLGDRVGKYFSLYKTAIENKNEPLTNEKKLPIHSIYDLINKFKEEVNEKDFHPKGVFELNTTKYNQLENEVAILIDNIKKNEDITHLKWLKKWLTIENGDTVVLHFLEKFHKILQRKTNEEKDNSITPVVLYYLFKCDSLSQSFRKNFANNYNRPIYNGKEYDQKTLKRMGLNDSQYAKSIKMIDELERLFDKSDIHSLSYFSIHPRYNDPKNFLLECFTKSRILHTNLALDYKYKQLFEQDDKWDLLFVIAEKTSTINFFPIESVKEEEEEKKYDFAGKKVIIINAYEAIKQFHSKELKSDFKEHDNRTPEEVAKKFPEKLNKLNNLQKDKYLTILKKHAVHVADDSLEVKCLPAMQHNHHMMLFMKRGKVSPDQEGVSMPVFDILVHGNVYTLNMLGALYMYRQGFSTSINPVYIGDLKDDPSNKFLANDFTRLLRIFSKIYRRAERFKEFPESDELDIDFTGDLVKILEKKYSKKKKP